MEAENTNGQWIFAIPEIGEWIVTATDGTDTSSKTVEITTEGQSINIKLRYITYVYEQAVGPEDTWYTGSAGSWTDKIWHNDEGIAFYSTGKPNFFADTKIDLTDIDTLYFDMAAKTKDNVKCIVNGTQVNYTTSTFAAEAMSTGGLTSLDVSALQGEYYYGFKIAAGSSSSSDPFYCHNIYY
jgi:hypothetical protein